MTPYEAESRRETKKRYSIWRDRNTWGLILFCGLAILWGLLGLPR